MFKWITAISALLFLVFSAKHLLSQESDYIRTSTRSIFFLYRSNTEPCQAREPDKILNPIGSGFVVGLTNRELVKSSKSYQYLITAEHVIRNHDSVILRLNRRDRTAFVCSPLRLVRQGNKRNVFNSRPEVDLVAIRLPDIPDTHPVVFDYSMILDEEQMTKLGIEEGTDVFTVGYLYGYPGISRNHPVARFGKISLLSSEKWFRSERKQNEQAYIVDIPSTPGLSGAPVMLQTVQIRVHKGRLEYRAMNPLIVGVVKALRRFPFVSSEGNLEGWGHQGVAAIEPAENLRELMRRIAEELGHAGITIDLELGKHPEGEKN